MGVLSVSFADQSARSTANTSLASVPIGTASSDRVVVANVTTNNGLDPSSVTIGGVTGHFVQDGSGVPGQGWIWANVPTGTTATIVLGGATTGFATLGVFAVTGDATATIAEATTALSFATPFTSTTSAFSVAAGDALIAVQVSDAGTTNSYSAGVTGGTPFTDAGGDAVLDGAKAYASLASQVITGSVTGGSPTFLFLQGVRVHSAVTAHTQTVSVSCSSSTSFLRRTAKSLSVACASAAVFLKSTAKKLAIGCASSAVFITSRAFLVTVAVTCSSAMTMTRQAGKKVSAGCISAVSATRQTAKKFSVGCASSVSLLKSTAKKLAISCASSMSLAAAKVKLLTISVTCASSVSFAKATAKKLAVSCGSSVSFLRQIAKMLNISSITSTLISAIGSNTGTTYLVTVAVACTSAVAGTATSIIAATRKWVNVVKNVEVWTKEN